MESPLEGAACAVLRNRIATYLRTARLATKHYLRSSSLARRSDRLPQFVVLESNADQRRANAIGHAVGDLPHTRAKTRLGPPVAPWILGPPTMMVAPLVGH